MGKINTLDTTDDDHRPPRDHNESDDDDEGRQGFFVGGSEHSGQQVLGPADRERRAQHLFDAVRRAGAEELSHEESAKIRAGDPRGSQYQGSAYRLGAANDPVVAQPPVPQPSDSQSGPVVVRVLIWENGFSIDDGPLRTFEDPASQAFLGSLQRGVIPNELQIHHRGREVDLHMERRATPYVPPKAKPFSSAGQRLGAIVPEVVTIDDAPQTTQVSPDEAKKLLETAQSNVGVDASKPKGQIQIRQPNGERLIGEFNESHTVEDVRTFIVTALPDYSFQPFTLHTTYPKKMIDDESQTVVQAGIFKAVVVMVKDQ